MHLNSYVYNQYSAVSYTLTERQTDTHSNDQL